MVVCCPSFPTVITRVGYSETKMEEEIRGGTGARAGTVMSVHFLVA